MSSDQEYSGGVIPDGPTLPPPGSKPCYLRNGKPHIVETYEDVVEWKRQGFPGSAEWVVGRTEVLFRRVMIHTMFLGYTMPAADSRDSRPNVPVWETMIAGGPPWINGTRAHYDTLAKAKCGHYSIARLVRQSLPWPYRLSTTVLRCLRRPINTVRKWRHRRIRRRMRWWTEALIYIMNAEVPGEPKCQSPKHSE